ncbi:MAG: hypothetical protein AAGH89_15910 [Verrucomicrobiota bacterium]
MSLLQKVVSEIGVVVAVYVTVVRILKVEELNEFVAMVKRRTSRA